MKNTQKSVNFIFFTLFFTFSVSSLLGMEYPTKFKVPCHITIFPSKQLNFQLNLKDLCEYFQDVTKFKERIGQEANDQQTMPGFSYKQLINILNCYCEQVTLGFNDICFEKISATSQDTFLNKQTASKGTKILSMGDLHGSIHSLLRNFYQFYLDKDMDENFHLNNITKVICTGDYVDRGNFGIEVLCILLYLKLKNWDKVFLIRGNHEELRTNFAYGFVKEIMQKYPQNAYEILSKVKFIFNTFPSAIWTQVPDNKWVLFTHGGFDPLTLEKVKTNLLESQQNYALIRSEENLIANKYSWYDFKVKNKNVYMFDCRGTGFTNISDVIQILKSNNIGAIIRGHQHYAPGFKMLTLDTNGIPRDWHTIPNLKMPISLNQVVPIFTLSTATEICTPIFGLSGYFTGPTRSSYVKIKIGDSIEECTIEPIETSEALTNSSNLNKIIPQANSEDEASAAFALSNFASLDAENKKIQIQASQPEFLYADETLDDEDELNATSSDLKREYEESEHSYSSASSKPNKKRKIDE